MQMLDALLTTSVYCLVGCLMIFMVGAHAPAILKTFTALIFLVLGEYWGFQGVFLQRLKKKRGGEIRGWPAVVSGVIVALAAPVIAYFIATIPTSSPV